MSRIAPRLDARPRTAPPDAAGGAARRGAGPRNPRPDPEGSDRGNATPRL